MENYSEFENFLVYDDEGNLLGISQEAPVNAKYAFRLWYMDKEDKERLKELFTNNEE